MNGLTPELLQDFFTRAVKGLAAQGFERSVDDARFARGLSSCVYRGDKGRKCAIGHLIPDEVVRATMDELSSLEEILSTIGVAAPEHTDNWHWFNNLQKCHDSGITTLGVKHLLRAFAADNRLSLPPELAAEPAAELAIDGEA